VGDEVLTRLATLVGVTVAGEGEGAFDRGAVERRVAVGAVLADDGEQVAEQRPVVGREVLGDLVDGRRGAARVVGTELDVTAPVGGDGRPVRR
jgi:hypothetical protein